jgi:hypothetical protein
MGRFTDAFLNSGSSPESQLDGYKENATDRDGDGLVQEGTPFERPASSKNKKKKGFTMD